MDILFELGHGDHDTEEAGQLRTQSCLPLATTPKLLKLMPTSCRTRSTSAGLVPAQRTFLGAKQARQVLASSDSRRRDAPSRGKKVGGQHPVEDQAAEMEPLGRQ